MKIYDIAFIGLGASSLATLKLKYSQSPLSIIGIDKQFNNSRNNFFAFWMTDWMKQFDNIVTQKWNSWDFYKSNDNIIHQSSSMPYCVIRFQNWKKFCLENIKNLQIKEKNVLKIDREDDYFRIYLEGEEEVLAKKIYDSRNVDHPANGLKQHFIGFVIKTEVPHKKKIATLMDFRVSQDDGLHFIYCLPIDENHLLVESTVFSEKVLPDEWYKSQIQGYAKQQLQLEKYKIVDQEKGILPMFEIDKKNSNNYTNLGSRGGATKISSGYAFSFFLRQLTNDRKNYHSYWDKWMDTIFVNYLQNNNKTDDIFMKMSKSLSGDEFASFMMGAANWKTKLKVILSMPKFGFLKSYISSL